MESTRQRAAKRLYAIEGFSLIAGLTLLKWGFRRSGTVCIFLGTAFMGGAIALDAEDCYEFSKEMRYYD